MSESDWHPGDEDEVYRRYIRTGERVLFGVLGACAILTFVFAIVIMISIGGGQANLGNRLIIVVAAILILGGLDTQATRLMQRRRPLLAPDPPAYRRFLVLTTLATVGASALLLSLALFLP